MSANDLAFRSWFEQHREIMIDATGKCDTELNGFLHSNTSDCSAYRGSSPEACYVGVLVDCLLDNLPESIKANSAFSDLSPQRGCGMPGQVERY